MIPGAGYTSNCRRCGCPPEAHDGRQTGPDPEQDFHIRCRGALVGTHATECRGFKGGPARPWSGKTHPRPVALPGSAKNRTRVPLR